MLTVVAQEGSEKQQEPVSLLDQLVRDGARQMLSAALRAEVADYIEQFADVRDDTGHRLVVRNGYHDERAVVTGAGTIRPERGSDVHGHCADQPTPDRPTQEVRSRHTRSSSHRSTSAWVKAANAMCWASSHPTKAAAAESRRCADRLCEVVNRPVLSSCRRARRSTHQVSWVETTGR